MGNRILYVEDDQFLRDWVDYELSCEGYRVELASDGKAGLDSARSGARPDLIILDIGLPGMDGFQLCRELQQDAAVADIPVIFLSARHAIDDKLRGFEAGGLDYLPKPFVMSELKARVQSGLRRQQMGRQQERRAANAEMNEASRLQSALMQRSVATLPCIERAAHCRPARHVAGDWYDFQNVADEALYVLEADVSGKGVSAALVMSETRLSLQQACRNGEMPGAALSIANSQLYSDLTTAGKFVTAFLGRYDAESARIAYASAGHPAVQLRAGETRAQLVEPADPPLGVLDDYTFSEHTLTFTAGDLLVICSDGINEAESVMGEMYGQERLFDAIERFRSLPASQIAQALLDDVDHFSAGMAQSDDQTVIVLKAI